MRLTKLPKPLQLLETAGKSALVSVLENGNQHFIVIINMDYKEKMSLTLVSDDSLKRVLKDGRIVPASVYTNTIDIEAGDMVVYTY